MMLRVREATNRDVISLSQRLRDADLDELWHCGRDNPADALWNGLWFSDRCLVAVDENDEAQIIWGVVPLPDASLNIGAVWMLASDSLKDNWIQVLRETRYWLGDLSKGYDLLTNSVYAENTVHIRWIRWAGFTFVREHKKPRGGSFYEFALIPTGDAPDV